MGHPLRSSRCRRFRFSPGCSKATYNLEAKQTERKGHNEQP